MRDRLGSKAPFEPDPDLDPDFYASFYPDMRALPDDQARALHYVRSGRAEGRHANLRAYVAALEMVHGALPLDFDPRSYRLMHADLRTAFQHDWQAIRHFVQAGRTEGREHSEFDADLYRALYFADWEITDQDLLRHYRREGSARGWIQSWRRYVAGLGLGGAAWVRAIKVDEFALLAADWAPGIATRLDAVRAMAEGGVARMAPLAFDVVFDPDHARECEPALAGWTDEALYRRWLTVGLDEGRAPSAAARLRAMGLPLTAYPAAFDWRGHAGRRKLASADRWSALADLLDEGHEDAVLPPADAPGASAFLLAVASHVRDRSDAFCIRALSSVAAAGGADTTAFHDLGDALYRTDRASEALAAYLAAATDPDATFWTFANGADMAVRLGRFRAAFDLLRRSLFAAGEPAWRAAVVRAVDAWFAARTARVRRFYALGPEGRRRADAHIARLVARTGELWREFGFLGLPVAPAPEGRVVMLANYDLAACRRYRVEQKRELFEALGRGFEVFGLHEVEAFTAALPGSAAAFVFRLPAWPSVTRAVLTARSLGVPTYYDIDDLLFEPTEFPDTFESYAGLISPEQYRSLMFDTPMIGAAMGMCDYGVASTTPLAAAMRRRVRTGEVFLLPNGLDRHNAHWLVAPPRRVRRDGGVLIACTSGTTAHSSDFGELAGPALLHLLETRPGVRLLTMGHVVLDAAFDAHADRITRFGHVDGSAAFFSLLAEADINLAVLKSTAATDAKSEIKWLEAAALGVPSVVSDTAPYKEVLEHGVDALIASTPDDWRDALTRLVDDADLRARMGAAARDKAARLYTVEANARRLEALLAPALARIAAADSAPSARAKPRILLVNVFFPPQTVGGATRVLRNNLDAWLDAGLDAQFDFMVVAADAGASLTYGQRVDDYRGVPVLRIAAPAEVNMDWRPQNEAVAAPFLDVLEGWRPDLVHFHAVQRLTASVVEMARLTGTPYLVTAHDAWWLSDWPFLTDDEGRVHPPCEDLPRHPPRGITIPGSLARRRVLRRALEGAEAVLGVSETFTAIYRDCGFARARAVPNGLPPMPAIARPPSASGRVRLAHVGNTTKHKGFHLVEAALRRNAFANLELTAIDHAAGGGSVRRETWGATPVRIVGKLPQERVHELYAETDVLLAPSIWPESFGLVAREALAAGCWVVAGDRGAMGEDVVAGANGFVVDVSTPDGLIQALSQIDADPARFIRPPQVRPPLRSADDQARDLLALYREVLARPRTVRGFEGKRPRRRTLAKPAPEAQEAF